MATEYITKAEASDKLYKLPCKIDEDGYRWVLSRDIAHMIDETPAADVRPVARGEWIWELADNGWANHICSCCGYTKNTDIHVVLNWNFCPNCGADMREVNRGEK